jgi:hypothetical protein
MPEVRKQIRVKTGRRKGKTRVWKRRWVKLHQPPKPPAEQPSGGEEAAEATNPATA